MARKQFVSSKKNAPSRAVSSKEAALHGRVGDANGGSDVDDDDDDEVDGNDSSGSGSPGSPASSNGSSVLTSDDEGELDDADMDAQGNGNDMDVDASSEVAVAVEVMPSSVGRGKQLRFPTVISRGKESRVFPQDGSQDDDDDDDGDSDSDSLLSIASDEEEEDDKSSVDGLSTQQKESAEDTTMLDDSETAATTAAASIKEDEPSPEYLIKGFRARKRHRPDSGYYKQMSTYVRDCLLTVRDGGEAADVFTEESHEEFRRKLSAGAVERVTWKEASPPAEEPVASAPLAATATAKSAATGSDKKKEEPSVEPVKKEKHKKEHRTKEKRSEGSSGSKSVAPSSSSNRKREEVSAATSSSSRAKEAPEAVKSAREVKKEEIKKEVKTEERSSLKAEPAAGESTRKVVKTESASTSSSSRANNSSTVSSASSSSNGASSTAAAADKSKGIGEQPSTALCSSCKKKLSDDKEPEKPKKTVTIAPAVRTESVPTFIIPSVAGRDVTRLRADASRLNEEARALKHEGNRKGAAEPGVAGQIAQGKCYLRSSAKFFQHALKLADIKVAYKEAGDERHARSYGEFCITTLSQTSSLIESTIRTFQIAGSTRMVALGYKLMSIVHLTIYRLQHIKLFSLYSDLFTPGRSPDTRQNGTPTPPIGGSNPDSREAAVRTHLLKEMEHTLRGFEMWRRYESCRVEVLPRITNPAITDLSVLFEDLHSELGSS